MSGERQRGFGEYSFQGILIVDEQIAGARTNEDLVDAGERCRYSARQPVRYIVPMMRSLTLERAAD